MSALRDFAADLLELCGAAVVPLESEEADVLSPASVQEAMAWPEIARLSFGAERSEGAIPIGLEGDCLERFERLLGTRGTWTERALAPAPMTLRDHERILDRALELPNAVWRLQSVKHAQPPLRAIGISVFRAVGREARGRGSGWASMRRPDRHWEMCCHVFARPRTMPRRWRPMHQCGPLERAIQSI